MASVYLSTVIMSAVACKGNLRTQLSPHEGFYDFNRVALSLTRKHVRGVCVCLLLFICCVEEKKKEI